jgi:hypothetical protein
MGDIKSGRLLVEYLTEVHSLIVVANFSKVSSVKPTRHNLIYQIYNTYKSHSFGNKFGPINIKLKV